MKLVSTEWSEKKCAEAAEAFPGVRFVPARGDNVVGKVEDAEIVFGHIGREAFLAAKALKWIQYGGAGVEKLLATQELVDSDVIVTNTSGAHAATIAESTFGMLVYLARRYERLLKAQDDHIYVKLSDYDPVGLAGMTVGIIGLGNIGKAIARRAHAFEMDVIAVDAHEVEVPDTVAECRLLDGLHDLLSRSDVVVVSTPLTARSRGMIGPEEVGLLKKDAYLLVVSRGGIVDEPSLIVSLESGNLAGAGLDVQATEPMPPDDPLWDTPNIIITPHCCDVSARTSAAATAMMEENLRRYLAGAPLHNIVDKKLGY